MRYLASLVISLGLLVFVLWVGAQINIMVSQGSKESSDFLRGQMLERCGYQVDARFNLAGYDLDEWRGERCEDLSQLDHCVLSCLADAGAIEIAEGCFMRCVGQ